MQPMDLSKLGQSSAGPDLSKTTAMECKCGGQFSHQDYILENQVP